MPRNELDDLPEVKAWLQEWEKGLYSEFLNSNFYEEISPFFLDGGSYATAVMYSEDDVAKSRVMFSTRHLGEIYIAEDRYGMVDTTHRKYLMTAKCASDEFGDSVLSDKIVKSAKEKPDTEYEFIHAVFPNNDQSYGKIDSANKPFTSAYIEATGEKILKLGGYDDNPYFVWRWRKNAHEVYGRGPAHDALIDIRALNQIRKDTLTQSQRAAAPPMNVPDEMKFKVRLTPDGLNYYKDTGRYITPINTGSNFTIAFQLIEDYREIIKKHFRVDFFLMLAEAERQMTATEIIERQGEKAAVLGSTIGRLNNEVLNPLIDRITNIAYKSGRLPPPPDVLLEYGGGKIDVDYMGPLAQAQRRLFKTQGVMRSLEAVAGIVQIMPEVLDNIDPDVVAKELLESFGFPQKAIRKPEDVEEIRTARAQAQEAAQQAELAKTYGQAAPGLNQPINNNSPLGQLVNAVGAPPVAKGA
jgi:hypothetical protein